MKKIKAAAAVCAAVILCASAASAAVLGEESGGWSTYMGASTYFRNVRFTSDSVGSQNEYYVEYTPNSEAVPVVINGASIWGTRTIKQAEEYMEANSLRPLVGINADYFSFKTGIPMGYTISGGELISKEYGGQDAIGFRDDGTGFIDWLDIATTLYSDDGAINIQYVNKWCQSGFDPVYLLTDKFSSSTKTESECIFVICTPDVNALYLDRATEMTVDDIFIYNGAVEIPDGKMVFVMDISGDAACYDFLSRLYVGQRLTVTNTVLGDEEGKWSDVTNAVSSVGGRLITNGVVHTDFEAGAAPRTAVGVKENGNIIFYTLDGRQTGYSYGAQLKTLASRMAELGCVDAVNLDGGGSTVISARFPGNSSSTVVNSPSEGSLRSVANFIFLKDNRRRTDIPWIVNFGGEDNLNYLSGMTDKIVIESVYDTSNYEMSAPYDIQYRAETDTQSGVDEEGYVYLNGTGNVDVVLYSGSGDITTRSYGVYETPEEIKIYNRADWKEITAINAAPSEELQLSLSAASYVNGIELHSNNDLYTWEIEGDIGTVTEDGIFTLNNTAAAEGKILVTAGSYTKEIPVTISDYPALFADIEGHWAKDVIEEMANSGIISGLEEDGHIVFKPENNMTRAEFASMITKYMSLNTADYADTELDFADAADIPQWAVEAVKAVYGEGIMLGNANDDGTYSFAPYANITRAEAFTILGRILPDIGDVPALLFTDKDDIPDWAVSGMQKLYSLGIISGYEDGTILPQNSIKRAEAAVMLYNTEIE